MLRQSEKEFDERRDALAKGKLGEARASYARALAVECEFWRQKSSIRWLREGDTNTKFFHFVVKQRRNTNFIGRIKDETGRWVEDEGAIKHSATQFYQNLFTSERQDMWLPCWIS